MIAPSTLSNAHSDGDSDSSWDDDDDFGARKINIKIKPIAQVTPSKISASVDELRATVGTWKSLANINLVKPNSRRHHQSTVQLNNVDNEVRHSNSILSPQPSTNSVIIPENIVFTPPIQNSNGPILQDNGFNNYQQQQRQKRYAINFGSMSHGDNLGDQMLVTNQLSTQPTIPQDFGDCMGLDSPIFENTKCLDTLLKTSSSSILSPGIFSAFKRVSIGDKTVLPVALAIQESLNVDTQINSNQTNNCRIIGSIKMAVPPVTSGIYASKLEDDLDITLTNHVAYDKIRLNSEFVSEISDNVQIHITSNLLCRRFLIDIKAVQNYVMKLDRKQSTTRYILLPELVRYSIRSQERTDKLPYEVSPSVALNPLQVQVHWLCDLNDTKVRVDIQFLPNLVGSVSSLTMDDIKNVKISMHVNGDVASYQSKPDASWNPLEAKLTWSFSNLTELMLKSTLKGATSCLARFNLNDGPSTPSDTTIQFSIAGKTISGSYLRINNSENFRLATQKFEVRTGAFKCQPPRL